MLQVHPEPPLRNPLMICAFEGWNDAGEAASRALAHLARVWEARQFAQIDPEDYYDYQVNRPEVERVSGRRVVRWPTTRFQLATRSGLARDIVLVAGIEPSMRWQQFNREVVGVAQQLRITTCLQLGAMLTEVPHTRPLPVSATSEDPSLAELFRSAPSDYEGVTGIVGVLSEGMHEAGIPTVGVWASVPHYAGGPPAAKATLALVSYLEEVLGTTVPTGDLEEDARAWEHGVDAMVREEEDLAEYITAMERDQDTAELPEASGDAIAREFERYLKRRDEPGD